MPNHAENQAAGIASKATTPDATAPKYATAEDEIYTSIVSSFTYEDQNNDVHPIAAGRAMRNTARRLQKVNFAVARARSLELVLLCALVADLSASGNSGVSSQ